MTATRRLVLVAFVALPASALADPAKYDLSKNLTAAGFKFKTLDDGCQEVVINKDNWLFYTSLSKNGKNVWLEFPCTKIKGTPNPDDLTRLLNENNRSGTSYFAVGKDGQIRIWKSVPAIGLTPDGLKDEIDDLRDFALRTELLWDVSNWKTQVAGGK